jgi:hypothetical protein
MPMGTVTTTTTEVEQPNRPIYRKPWFLIVVGLILLIIIIAALTSGGSDDEEPTSTNPVATPAAPVIPTAPAPTAAAPTAAAPTAAAPTAAAPAATAPATLTDGDWTLESYQIKEEEFTNSFTGTARITYNGSDEGALNNFTLTIFKGGQQVGTLQGTILDTSPGQTKTVDLISTDDYVAGPWTVEFQKDL